MTAWQIPHVGALSRYQAEMLMMKKAPRMNAPISVCTSRLTEDGLNTSAQKSTTLGAHHRFPIDEPRLPIAHHLHDVMPGRRLLPTVGHDDPDG